MRRNMQPAALLLPAALRWLTAHARRARWVAALLLAGQGLAPALAAPGEVRINTESLGRLPDGAVVHESVRALPEAGGILFEKGGITLPMAGQLTPASGSVDLWCRMPDDWPAAEDRTLLHAIAATHVHVTLFFRDGVLLAVYKGGEEHFASVRFAGARGWKPGSWHHVQFGWQAAGKDVDFVLLTDGNAAGMATGYLIETWPATCQVGIRDGRSPWKGLLRDILLSPLPIALPAMEPGERTVTIHGDREVGDCYRFWTIGNYNKPHLFLDPGFGPRIARSQPYVKQVNAVYLLGGRYRDQNTWFQGIEPGGGIRAEFTGMVAQLKGMQDAGFVPWIVLDNVPYAMSNPPQENAYGNTAPPQDEAVWGRYVEAEERAMLEAFGREKVAGWWFRVGTEPDLSPGHWAGTREQYLAHYDETVRALARVLPEARAGPGNILNPAGGEFGTSTRRQWGLEIIDHAGANGTRMDWFSFSWYGRVGEPLSVFDDAVTAVRKRLARYPRLAGLPLVVGEFAVLHDEHGHRLWAGDTTEWAASFYAALARRVYTHGVLHVYEWAQTTGGVPHPRTNVIALLEQMAGGKRLAVDVDAASAADCGAIACRKGEDLFVLLYNHRPLRRPKVREGVHLMVRDPRMKAGAPWTLTEWAIDAEHASWAYAFEADCAAAGIRPLPAAGRYEGSPGSLYGKPGEELFRKNVEKYARLAALPKTRDAVPAPVAQGRFAADCDLPGHSVRLLRLTPAQ